MSDRDAAERFSAAVIEFSASELARGARRTKAAAKGWKDASRAPSLASAINLARSLPQVQAMLADEMGIDRAAQASSVDAVIRQLYLIAAGDGDEARKARELLAWINKREPAPMPENRGDNVIHDLFERRRA